MFEILDSISLERVTEIVHFLIRIVVKEDNEIDIENIPTDLEKADEKIVKNILRSNGFYTMTEVELEEFANKLYEYLEYREEKEYDLDIEMGKNLIERMKES